MTTFLTCKEGCEKILANEVTFYKGIVQKKGSGWILAEGAALQDPCFAYTILEDPLKISAVSINSLTEQLVNLFMAHLVPLRVVEPWAYLFSSSGTEQLAQRTKTVEKSFLEKLLKKMSRVAKLAKWGFPQNSKLTEGFFVHFIDFDQAFVSFKALSAGQQRMQMDPQAPSRSYLKVEEAFHLFGSAPKENETVVDLGAAPGGWSYSALKNGATVTAIDNGPLKGPVVSNSRVKHLKADAFTYKHSSGKPADWLLCDILEKPEVVLELIDKWLNQKWCRRFIVNLKLGRTDPIFLLKKIRDPKKGLLSYCRILYVRQLYHNREEITLMGQVNESDSRK